MVTLSSVYNSLTVCLKIPGWRHSLSPPSALRLTSDIIIMNVYSLRPSDDNFNFVGPSVVDVEITEVCISGELS